MSQDGEVIRTDIRIADFVGGTKQLMNMILAHLEKRK